MALTGLTSLASANYNNIVPVTSPAPNTMGNGITYSRTIYYPGSTPDVSLTGIEFDVPPVNEQAFYMFNEKYYLRGDSSDAGGIRSTSSTADYLRNTAVVLESFTNGAEDGTNNWLHFAYISPYGDQQYVWVQFSLSKSNYPTVVSYAYRYENDFSLSQAVNLLHPDTWVGENNGFWDVSSNWDKGIPANTSVVGITNGTTAKVRQVGATGDFIKIGETYGTGAGHLSVEGTGTLQANQLNVGNGSLTAKDGGHAAINLLQMGTDGLEDTLSISGQGSKITSGITTLGYSGITHATISDGAVLEATDNVSLGYQTTGQADLTVSGSAAGVASELKADSLYVGYAGKGSLTVENGGKLNATKTAYVGFGPSAEGTFTVKGWGSQANFQSNLYVGDKGVGNAYIQDAAHVTTTGDIFIGQEGRGQVTVSGANSLLETLDVEIGYFGDGTLTIANGGSLTARSIVLAQSSGKATFNIGGSDFRTATDVGTISVESIQFIHSGGTPVLNIFTEDSSTTLSAELIGIDGMTHIGNLGRVKYTGNSLYYGGKTNLHHGTLQVDGHLSGQLSIKSGGTLAGMGGTVATTVVESNGVLMPGSIEGIYSVGSFNQFEAVGKLTVDGNLTMHEDAILVINMMGDGDGQYSQLHVTGDFLVDNIQLVLSIAPIYTPEAGDSFHVFTGHSFTGDYELVTNLPEGLYWDATRLQSEGILTLTTNTIPEPSTWALVTLGAIASGALLRRRQRAE